MIAMFAPLALSLALGTQCRDCCSDNAAPVLVSAAVASVDERSTDPFLTVAASDADGDVLVFSIAGGTDAGLFEIDPVSGELSFNQEVSWMAAGDNVYNVTVKAQDPGGAYSTQNVSVTVTNVVEALLFTSSANYNVNENKTAVGTVAATDPDGGTPVYSIAGGTDAAKFNINASSGALAFTAAKNYESPDDANADRVYNVTVRATVGAKTADQAISVTLNNVNEAPSITTSASLTAAENQTAVATIAATDPDAGTTLSYTITGGADAGKFNINSSTGALTFKTAPNYESPDDADANGVYVVTVTASDGTLTNARTFNIALTNVNEGPSITSGNTFSAAENQTAVGTVTATDPEGDTLTYSISGGADAAKFEIDPATGALRFKTAPDFENPTDA